MERQQASWLIVRAFGLYLLVQACVLVPEVLAGLVAARYYGNLMSSIGTDTGNGGSFTRVATSMYRTMAFGPLLRIVVYSAVGMYMLRGGRFLVHLLEYRPHIPTDIAAGDDAQQHVGPERR